MAEPAPAAKSYIVYDEYILNQPDGNLVCVAPGLSVDEFKQRTLIVHTLNKFHTDGNLIPFLAGENQNYTWWVASEKVKKFSRSLIKKLRMVEADRCCILNFEEDQIRVFPSGKVKLRGVHIVSKDDLGDANYIFCLEENYKVVRVVIEGLFFDDGVLCVPVDFVHLLNLLGTEFAARELFPDHASITPLFLNPALFKDMHDLLDLVSAAEYEAICYTVSLEVGIGIDWRYNVKLNDLLSQTYFFSNNGAQYELPDNYPNQKRLRSVQKAALKELCMTRLNPKELTSYELHVINGHQVLTFLRNRLAHRMEGIVAGLATWNSINMYDFSTLHSELVTLTNFHGVLSVLQFGLYQIGHLRRVELL